MRFTPRGVRSRASTAAVSAASATYTGFGSRSTGRGGSPSSSTVVVAEVLDIIVGADRGEPLVYHNREFHSLTDRSRLS